MYLIYIARSKKKVDLRHGLLLLSNIVYIKWVSFVYHLNHDFTLFYRTRSVGREEKNFNNFITLPKEKWLENSYEVNRVIFLWIKILSFNYSCLLYLSFIKMIKKQVYLVLIMRKKKELNNCNTLLLKNIPWTMWISLSCLKIWI